LSCVAKTELWDIIEKMARGKMQEEPILVSTVFADNMISLLEKEDCFEAGSDKLISINIIRQKLEDGTFDIDLFN
jgi:hypothetical protein